MRIRRIRSTIVSIPAKYPILSTVRCADDVINVILQLDTDEGLTGVSYVAAFTYHKAVAVCALIQDLAEAVCDLDAMMVDEVWDRMRDACVLTGRGGVSAFALSAIDLALWDLKGKALRAPVHRLLGTQRDVLQAYASDGCWLGSGPEQAAHQAAKFAAEGFEIVKVRFGRRDFECDLAVLRAVQKAVGDSVRVIVDVNQGWSREQALVYSRRLEDFRVEWLEEPIAADDIDGLAALHRDLPIPVVAGENVYMPEGAKTLVESRAVSMLMPDLQRVGGITGWLRVARIADAWQLPVTSHLFPEVSVHLLASSRMAGPLEWVTWMTPLLAEPLVPDRGAVAVPNDPGLGFMLDPEAVQRYRLD